MAESTRPKTRSKEAWLARANALPPQPGVYLMKDANERVIYVGKAKNLKARVRSYFQEGTSDYRAFVGILHKVLRDLETVVTASEKEALLLERELIRKHEPRFNVIWRDDKQYLCLRVDTSHEFPWVQVVRQMGKDGARYFGPFHSATAARQTLRVVNRHFQLRTCRDSVLYNRTRPCLEYQIGRCPAPCVLEIDRDKYKESVQDVVMFLEGKGEELVPRIEARMWAAADRLDYEVAAHYRNQITAVNRTLEKQRVALPSLLDQDVYGVYREGGLRASGSASAGEGVIEGTPAPIGGYGKLCIATLEIRSGRIQNVHTHLFEEGGFSDDALLESFLLQRYGGEAVPPTEILVPFDLEGAEALSDILTERRGARVTVKFPQRGDRASLLTMASENARHGFEERIKSSGALDQTLAGLKEKLRLRRMPERIECYDISNMGDLLIVGSGVCFVRGLPHKTGYRHYRIKTTQGQDDFASMYEVISRRARRGVAEKNLPDLIVIDGGKGQLNAARAALRDHGLEGLDIVSLAKSRITGTDAADANTRSPERIFVAGAKEPLVLRQDSPEVLLLARIRDEAHRFAITYQRTLRQKARMRSALDDVPGIGAVRRKALLKHLGSLKRVREASVEELGAVPGVGRAAAERVHAFFHAVETRFRPVEGADPPHEAPVEPKVPSNPGAEAPSEGSGPGAEHEPKVEKSFLIVDLKDDSA